MEENSLTYAIIIGVSEYASDSICDLKYAADDAEAFCELLHNCGIQNTALLKNSNATREAILKEVGVEAPLMFHAVNGRKRLIIYFSGHGFRDDTSSGLHKNYLLPYDAIPSYKSSAAIDVDQLIGAIPRSNADEVFLFVDACEIQPETIYNIFANTGDGRVYKTTSKAKYFCALFASAGASAFEDDEKRSGVFTESLIRNIQKFQAVNNPSMEGLFNCIRSDLSQGVHIQNPEFFACGSFFGWPFEKNQYGNRSEYPSFQTYYIDRPTAHYALEQRLLSYDKPIYIYGESGIGKTTMIKNVIVNRYNGIYISFSDDSAISSVESVVSDIAFNAVSIFPTGQPKESLHATLKYFSEHADTELIVFDHVEKNPKLTRELVEKLTLYHIRFVLSGKRVVIDPSMVNLWKCPSLSANEIKEFIAANHLTEDPNDLYVRCQGLPITLLSLIQEKRASLQEKRTDEVQYCIHALSATGGFVDERIFKRVFSIQSASLDHLVRAGKIISQNNIYILHDSIVDTPKSVPPELVSQYFVEQVLQTPNHPWVCRKLLLSIMSQAFVPKILEEKFADALSKAITKVEEAKDWELLKKVTMHLLNHRIPQIDALIQLAKIFAHRSNFSMVTSIEVYLKSCNLSEQQRDSLCIAQAEKCWWEGAYHETKEIGLSVIKHTHSPQIWQECHLHIGVAEFFLGNWDEAMRHFNCVENDDAFLSVLPRISGWALYLSGTILGLLGIDVCKGKELFRTGIRILDLAGDDSGQGIAWGNMAEMNWKLRDYDAAQEQANRGYLIAKETDNLVNQIENSRNMLHIYIRKYSVDDARIDDIIQRIYSLLEEDMGNTVYMQIWNTFATVYAYRNKVLPLWDMISRAIPYTKNNNEYHIYTLSNMCLYYCLCGETSQSIAYYEQATALAWDGKNYLAIRQINDDIKFIHLHYYNSTSQKLYQHIAPTVNKVEQKLKGGTYP